ncbi:hypothetical protein scyTo_0022238, partial [Scyliorhinus torazame]|nr:hypothetical protein [Scyliorhinus torazame]
TERSISRPPVIFLVETKPDSSCQQKADYLRYALRLTFNPNTAHKHLLLSDNNSTVTDVDPDSVPYLEHPE